MKKYKNKLATLSLLGLLGAGIIGCGNHNNNENDDTLDFNVTPFAYETSYEDDLIEVSSIEAIDEREEVEVETIEETEEAEENKIDIITVETAVAVNRTEIIEDLETKTVKGYLPEGKSLVIAEKLDNGYYKVEHFGEYAYLKETDIKVVEVFDIASPMIKLFYATEDTNLIIPDYLSETNEQQTVAINQFEVFEVYEETEILYLVQTPEYIGYIPKENVEELNGTIVVLDISDQKILVYKDNVLIKEYPTITGTPTPDRETTIGKWAVLSIRYNYGLQDAAKTYYSPVDIMIKFHGNQGFHDSTYHVCVYWQNHGRSKHGWRSKVQINTSDTYLDNGSHGCANMINEDVFDLAQYIEIGTPVIVKR